MERKTTLRWQLQDLLHATGEDGITQSTYGDHTRQVMHARVEPIESFIRGFTNELNIQERTGLPSWMNDTAKTYIFRAILAAMRGYRGDPPTLQWDFPITCGSQMKRSLEDRQLHMDDDRRFRAVTLRAQPTFQGRPARDNIKVWIEEDAGRSRLYFAMYVLLSVRKSMTSTLITKHVFRATGAWLSSRTHPETATLQYDGTQKRE